MADENLYVIGEMTEEQKQVLAQWEKVEAFQSIEITYDMGDEQIVLNKSQIGEFLIREEDGSFKEEEDGSLMISREKTDEYIDSLADEYDTYKKERTFQSTRGDLITLTKGTYGTLLNRDEEKEYLYNALLNGISETHVPAYKREAYHRGLNDIGDTYIEIDMTKQKMYLYKEGECLVETDIVTGNVTEGASGRKLTRQNHRHRWQHRRSRNLRRRNVHMERLQLQRRTCPHWRLLRLCQAKEPYPKGTGICFTGQILDAGEWKYRNSRCQLAKRIWWRNL